MEEEKERTREEILTSNGVLISDLISSSQYVAIKKAMEDYKKQGRYFTTDDIRKMEEQAYGEGYKAGGDNCTP